MQRSSRQKGQSEMQSGRHYRRPEKIDSRPDWYALGEDRIEEVVHDFQGPYKVAGLYPLS